MWEGDLLQVTMNVSRGQTRCVEQVGLLQYAGGKWQAVWGPHTFSPFPDLSIVFQPPAGIDRYTVFHSRYKSFHGERDIHVREDWKREGAQYLQITRTELSPEEYIGIRFALALLSQNEHELRSWATSEALERAENLGLAESLREGFRTHKRKDGAVLLETESRAKSWRLTLASEETGIKVTGIR